MKLSGILLLIVIATQVIAFSGIGYGQKILQEKVSFSVRNLPLTEVLDELSNASGVKLMYLVKDLSGVKKVTYSARRETLGSILSGLLAPYGLTYLAEGNYILIKRLFPENSSGGEVESEEVYGGPNDSRVVSMARDDDRKDIRVSGRVTDEKGEGLPGVSILVKRSSRGTNTNSDGHFQIDVSGGSDTLVFSYVGYKSAEIGVGQNTELTVRLQPVENALDELVVVGYGHQVQREITGSIATLKTDQLEDQPVGQLMQKLQGRIAGVQINQASGQPGGGMVIRIRGAASINAGNTPLYVVDGFPIVGDINNINPHEIESLSVLKGPSASALYGSRAANGVVLITTKKGTSGKTTVNLDISYGVGKIPQKGRPDLMNAREFLQFQKELFEDRIRYEGYAGGIPEIYQNPEQYSGKSTDWYDVLLKNTGISRYNLSVTSGSERFSSSTTLGYFKEKGAMLNTGFERYSLRSNNVFKLNDRIRGGFSVAPTFQTSQNFSTDGEFQLLYSALSTPPIFSPFDTQEDGSQKLFFSAPGTFAQPNWYRTLTESTNRLKSTRLLSNAYGEIDILDGLRFKTSVSVDLAGSNHRSFKPSTVGTAANSNLPRNLATAAYNTNFYYSWLTENTLHYSRTFLTDHSLDVLAGYSAQRFREEFNGLTGLDFPDDAVSWIDAAAIKNGSSNVSEWSLLSAFGRVNYNYKGKYLVSGSLRRDGSSRFGFANRWGTFPSVSAGWIISDEAFLSGQKTIDYLKLRAEYGLSGNFNIGNYTQFGNIASTNYVFGNSLVQGRSPATIGNSQLTWETSGGLDVGVDIGLFGNRVFLTADYYHKITRDMLYQIDIPSGTGFTNIQSNVGRFKFWGYEFAVNSKNLTGSVKWNSDVNISFNRNKVLQLGTNNTPIGGIGEQGETSYWKTEVGRPIGLFHGYVWDGVYMTQAEFDSQAKHITSAVGTTRMKDLNNDGVIDNRDKTYIGNPNPDFVLGFTNTFSYRNVDLTIVASGAYGADMFVHRGWNEILEGNFNVRRELNDRWRSLENPGAGIHARSLSGTAAFGRFTSSKWLFPASYLTIKNITAGYTFPSFIKGIDRLRAYASVHQALVLTNYVGANPEATKNGLNGLKLGFDATAYPVPRTFSIGINAIL